MPARRTLHRQFLSPAAAMAETNNGNGEHPGWAFFRSMGSPKFHVAPMVCRPPAKHRQANAGRESPGKCVQVDQSELAFRMLCRKYGA